MMCSAGLVISSFVTSFPLLYLTYGLLMGLGSGLAFNASLLVVLKYFVKWRALAVGITFSSVCLGTLTVTQATSVLLTKYGLQGTLRAMGVLAGFPCITACVYDPVAIFQDERHHSLDCLRTENEHNFCTKLKWIGLDLFRVRSFVVFTLSVVVMSLGYYVPTVHMVGLIWFLRGGGGGGFCT